MTTTPTSTKPDSVAYDNGSKPTALCDTNYVVTCGLVTNKKQYISNSKKNLKGWWLTIRGNHPQIHVTH